MANVLIVDDHLDEQNVAGRLLEKIEGVRVSYARSADEALRAVNGDAPDRPDVVLTDLVMPDTDGLGLIARVRQTRPEVPVILMTSFGSEEFAVKALRKGAASYVSKAHLVRDLREIVRDVLAVAGAEQKQRQMLECMTQSESHFSLSNDPSLTSPLIGYLQQNLCRLAVCDDTKRMHVGMALQEALANAIFHGNLEVSSDLKAQGSGRAFYALAEQRRGEAPYRDRRVHVTARETRREAVYVIRDEGPGFRVADLPDPLDPANLEKPSGRGLFLIRTFMDHVEHNARGNEITLRVCARARAECS